MTTTLDDKRRAVIKAFQPGDVIEIEPQGADAVLLRRMKPVAKKDKPRLVRRKSGDLVFVGGAPVSSEEVKRMLEDDL